MSPHEVKAYLKNEEITDIAIEASARLFCTPEEAAGVAAAVRAYGG